MAELSNGTVLRGQTYSYRIERMLGSGTFGITYLAVVSDGAGPMNGMLRVCVKEFYMHDINGRNGSEVTCSSSDGMFSEYRRKFMREAENLASINHPHIIHVLEAFEQNNTVYYVMEFVAGGSLDSFICKHGRMDEASALKCLAGIAEGLQYMHSQKMLHLDLKPANVMLKNDGSPVLIDFGLSKQYNEKGEPESSTKVGSGTPGYAPVEQANYHDGHGFPVTMDVYALGGTLFKMLTGERPPEASMVLNDGLPVDLLQRYGVSKATIAAIIGAMAPIVKQRTPDVASFVQALPLGSAYKSSGSSKASSSTKTSSYSSSSSSSSFKRKKDVSQNLSEGIVYLTPDTTCVKIILNGVGKAQGKSWFFTFTPSKISVVELNTYDYRSFFSSKQRFGSVLERINALRLSVAKNYVGGDISLDERFMCTLIAERENEVYVDAVSGAEFKGDSYYLKGDVAALAEIVENETGVDATGRKWKRQRIKNFVIMGVVAVVALAAWWMFKGNNSSTYNNVESEQSVEQTNSSETAEQQQQALPEICNEQAVDLGLSSGTIWAGWNVGATSAEQCGDYYAWGETKTKKKNIYICYFDLKKGSEKFITYNNEGGKTSIRCSKRDVAWVKWGHKWAIPTKDQADELVRECTWTWMKYNGANGFAVTGPNGKSLFMPAAGLLYTGLDNVNEFLSVGSLAWYWTSDLDKDDSASAYSISFFQKKAEVQTQVRPNGVSVRPVRVK